MELRVNEIQLPAKIDFNYEELKTQLTERCEEYRTSVYTEDSIKSAKADRAMLNRLKDSLNAERLRRQKEYMRPFEDFKIRIDELIGIIDAASSAIDGQVKAFEELEKEKKKADISAIFDGLKADKDKNIPEFVVLVNVWDQRWLNKSKTLKTIAEEMTGKLEQIVSSVSVIESTCQTDAEKSAAMSNFKRTFDVREALTAAREVAEEMKRREAAKLEAERRAEALAQDNTVQGAQRAENTAETIRVESLPQEPETPVSEAPERAERVQKVVVSITAKESQFSAVNELFRNLKTLGITYTIESKEEI